MMDIVKLKYNKNHIQKSDMKKLISFISPQIIEYDIDDEYISLLGEHPFDLDKIKSNYYMLIEKNASYSNKEQVFFENEGSLCTYTTYDELVKSGIIIPLITTSLHFLKNFSYP